MAKSAKVDIKDGKEKSLAMALDNIKKQFGAGAIMKMDESAIQEGVDVCPSGSLTLDLALGVNGLPYGRVVEIYGPESSGKTTLTLEVIAQAQKENKVCAFIDAENAFDANYARALGVKVEELLLSQPDCGEDALEIVDILANSGAVNVIIVDSVAGLVPKAEIEGDMGDSHMGLQARLMSQALRKLTGAVKKQNVLLIFINQIRMKIGVMFGCLHGDTIIPFTDGRNIPISQVVKDKIKGSVFSLNEKTNKLEAKEIVDWHYNGDVETQSDYKFLLSKNIQNNTIYQNPLTEDHEVKTLNRGWVKVKDLNVKKDILTTKKTSILNGELLEFVKGCLVAGSQLKYNEQYKNYDLKLKKTFSGESYLDWKASKLKALNIKKNKHDNYISNINEFNSLKHTNGNPLKIFKDGIISDIAMTVWFMEQGYIDRDDNFYLLTYFTKKEDLQKLSEILEKNGYCNKIKTASSDNHKTQYCFNLSVKNHEKLKTILAQHGHINTLFEFFGLEFFFEKEKWEELLVINEQNYDLKFEIQNEISKAKIISISDINEKKFNHNKGKYDLSIKDNHNYLAGGFKNGIIVHNSPETTTGGNALKFYASIRLDIRKTGTIKKGDESVGNETKVKVIKNKVAPPFKEAHFDIIFGKGINRTGEILDLAVKADLINKAGAWYSLNDSKIGQGRDNSVIWLNDNIEIRESLYKEIIKLNQKTNIIEEVELSDEDKKEIETQDKEE